jgi:outer membrane protein OmpA-like peptidoglycan-associated protein
MKKLFTLLALLLPALAAQAQGTADTAKPAPTAATDMGSAPIHRLKSADQVLPRWSFDLGYRFAKLSQTLEMIDMKKAYGPNNLSTSRYVNPTFSDGSGNGGEAHINYFFNKSRTLGVGIGAQYIHYVGKLTMDTMYSDYQATDNKGRTYRQIIRTNGPLTEDVKINNLNVPLLLKFKHQFGRPENPSNFGITADLGPVFGFYNQTQSDASGKFSYEAVYKVSPSGGTVSGFDAGIPPNADGTSFVITEQAYNVSHNFDGGASKWFDDLHRQNEGFNVGLNKSIAPSQRSQNTNYNAVSIGAMIQAGITYQLSYHVTFMLSGYYMYQRYRNNSNDGYRPTELLVEESGTTYANYKPLTGGVKTADYTSYGLMAGFRVFFGEKKDVDGDGVPDVRDRCRLDYGEVRFNGCPDRDHDNIPDAEDACPDDPGGEETNGCPDDDHDGVPNKSDKCPYEYGELRDGCPISTVAKYTPVDSTLKVENGTYLPPHLVLETDVLYFAFKRADIQDSVAKVLDYAVRILDKDPRVVIYISGYTDDIGDERSNLFLSYQRAKSAKTYLVKHGVAEKRIIIGSYGMENPAVPNTTPENKAKNRRVEMKLLLPL